MWQLNKNEKMQELVNLAEINVDIDGIGMYTLGKYRKILSEEQKKNMRRCLKNIF